MPSIAASILNSSSSTLKSIIRCGPLAWALIIGGIAVTVFSFLVDGEVQQFLTATCEEFWTIMILTLLSLWFTELRSTKKPCKKKMLEDDEIDLSPKKELNMPLKAPSPAETEERQQNEKTTLNVKAPVFQPNCQTALRAEAPAFETPAFQSTNEDELEHRKPGQSSWNWSVPLWGRTTNSQKKHEDTYSIESWGLLRASMGKLSGNAETPTPMSWGSKDNSDLAGMWKAGTGESYEVWAIDEKSLLCRRGDSWEWKEFVLKYDDHDKLYWWGDSKKLYFDPTDVLTNRNEITWYRANDVQKRFPTFVWQKESNAVHEEPAWQSNPKYEEPAWRSNAKCEKPEWRSDAQYEKPAWRSDAQYEKPEWWSNAQYEKPEWWSNAQYDKPEWRSNARYKEPEWPSHAIYEEPEWPSNANYDEFTQAWRTPKWMPKATATEDAVQSEKHWQRKAWTATDTSSGYLKWVPKS